MQVSENKKKTVAMPNNGQEKRERIHEPSVQRLVIFVPGYVWYVYVGGIECGIRRQPSCAYVVLGFWSEKSR